MINVYIDGACSNNGKDNALSGYGIYFGENDPKNVSKQVDGNKHTNNIAELTAFIKVLELLQENIIKNETINIYTDSEYVIKCAGSYGSKLENNNWLTSNNKKPPNIELVKIARNLFKDLQNVKLFHIKAHTNKDDVHSIGNSMADKLANMAIGNEQCPYNNDNKVYLNILYSNKELAKTYGAKWDKNKKSWYYDNDISEENKENLKDLESKVENTIVKIDNNTGEKNYINIAFSKKNIAKNHGAKWDAVKKSWYFTDNISEENKKKLLELQH